MAYPTSIDLSGRLNLWDLTPLSTALLRNLGLAEGQTVALFSPNSIWYPVAMFATNRIGKT